MMSDWIMAEIPGTDALAHVYVDDRTSLDHVPHGEKLTERWFRWEKLRGIYILLRDDVVIWVGKTDDLHVRLDCHRGGGRQFDVAFFLPHDGDLHPPEMKWTARLRPTEISPRTQLAADRFTDEKYANYRAASARYIKSFGEKLRQHRILALDYV